MKILWKCYLILRCKCVNMIPIAEEDLRKDQREDHIMYTGSVDQVTTKFIHHQERRKRKYGELMKTTVDIPSTSSIPVLECSFNSYSTVTSETDLTMIRKL